MAPVVPIRDTASRAPRRPASGRVFTTAFGPIHLYNYIDVDCHKTNITPRNILVSRQDFPRSTVRSESQIHQNICLIHPATQRTRLVTHATTHTHARTHLRSSTSSVTSGSSSLTPGRGDGPFPADNPLN